MKAYYRCGHCEEIYKEGDEVTHTISGRTGGYENWLPDEHVSYCPHCETDVEEAGADELDMDDLIESIEYYKELAEKMMTVARRAVANLGDARNPSTLAYAYRQELNDLEGKG